MFTVQCETYGTNPQKNPLLLYQSVNHKRLITTVLCKTENVSMDDDDDLQSWFIM